MLIALVVMSALGLGSRAAIGFLAPGAYAEEVVAARSFLEERRLYDGDPRQELDQWSAEASIGATPWSSVPGIGPCQADALSDRARFFTNHAHTPMLLLAGVPVVMLGGGRAIYVLLLLMSLAGILGMAAILLDHAGVSLRSRPGVLVLAAIAGWQPVLAGIRQGDAVLPVAALAGLAWHLARRHHRPAGAAVAAGLAACFALPALAVLPALLRSWLRPGLGALILFAAAVAATIGVAGAGVVPSFLETASQTASTYAFGLTNYAVFGRAHAAGLSTTLVFALGLTVVAVSWVRGRSVDDAFAAFMLTGLLFAPVIWSQHLALVLVPAVVLLRRLLLDGSSLSLTGWALLILLFSLPDASAASVCEMIPLRSAGAVLPGTVAGAVRLLGLDRRWRSPYMKTFLVYVARELRWGLVAAAGVAVTLALAEGAGLLLLVPMLASTGLLVDQGPTSGLGGAVAGLFARAGMKPTLAAVLGVFLVVSILRAVLYRASLLLNPALEQRIAVRLQNRLYAAIVRAEWTFFITRRNTDLVHTLTSDIDRASATAYQLLTLFTGLVVSSVYIAIAFWLSPLLTALVLVSGSAVLWLIRRRGQRSAEMGDKYREADQRQFNAASESIAGVKVAKTFGAESRGIRLFSGHAEARAGAYLDLLRSFARAKLGLDLASAVLISALLYVAVEWFAVRGAGLLLLVVAFARVMPRLMSLQESAQLVSAGLPSFFTVMRLANEAESQAERLGDGPATRLGLKEGVRFDEVSYTYGGASEPALDRVSLAIAAGRTTAIVGESGAGKSTAADLLMGLLRPGAGRVLVDGRPLAGGEIAAWRHSVAYVPQESFLLHDTVRANLLWARPEASEAEMWRALERASAAAFLRARPDGLDTVVGERGLRLSGGERQRLALARAFLTEPDLLVLDEATSALDSPGEAQILGAVRQATGRITTVIITHRLSAIQDADVIHVLERGRLVESGTWAELTSRPGAFARLLRTQGLTAADRQARGGDAAAMRPAI